jgi:hypothetical protein
MQRHAEVRPERGSTGQFAKGRAKTGGRKKGASNRFTVEIDEMIDEALLELGGVKWLVRKAREKPEAFLALLGKRVRRRVDVDIPAGGTLAELIEASYEIEARKAVRAETPG